MHLNRKSDAEEEHGTQPHASESQCAEEEPEGIKKPGVKNPGNRLGVRGSPEGAKAPVEGDAHAEAEEGRKSRAPEKPAPQGVKADKVQENGQSPGPEYAVRRVPVIREPVRHAHEEVRDAREKGVGGVEGIAPAELGTEPGRQYLRVVLKIAVHAHAIRKNQFGTREGSQTEKGGAENKDAVSRTDAHQIYLPENMAAVPGGGKDSLLVQLFRLKFCFYVVKQKTNPDGRRCGVRVYIFFWKVFSPDKQASVLFWAQGNRNGGQKAAGRTGNSPSVRGR